MPASVSIAAAIEDGARANALREALIGQQIAISNSAAIGTDLLVALCSRQSIHSTALLEHVEEAARLDLPILPVRLDDTPMPPSLRYFTAGVRGVPAADLADSEFLTVSLSAIHLALDRLGAKGSSLAPFDREATRRDLETRERGAAQFRILKLSERTLMAAFGPCQ